jgi:hypothetical protein
MQTPTDMLSRLIQQKFGLLVQLRELGAHQIDLIRSGDMTQLLRLLAAKQRLLKALSSVERSLDPFRGEEPEKRAWPSPLDRERCAQTASACEALLDTIVEQERYSQTQMTIRRDEVSARLEAARGTVEARQAYADHTVYPASQLDLTQG